MSSTSVETSLPTPRAGEPAAPAAPAAAPALPALASGVPTSVFGFAVVVTMLSFVNTGILDSGAVLVPAFMVVGTVAIGVGGLYELRNGDLFGGTFGVAFAAFLLATGLTLRFFAPAADATAQATSDFNAGLGTWFLLWALISGFFVMAARLVNLTAVAAFALLTLVLLLAGLANVIGGDTADTLTKAAGWAGLVNGAVAFWLAGGLMLNTMYDRDLLPLGRPMATAGSSSGS